MSGGQQQNSTIFKIAMYEIPCLYTEIEYKTIPCYKHIVVQIIIDDRS